MKELKNLDEKNLIFIDIETARGQYKLEQPFTDAWTYKARYQNELNKKTGLEYTVEEYYNEKAALYPPFGRVVCITVGRIKNNKIALKSYASYSESELLNDFNNDLQKVVESNPKTTFVTFNGVGFDIPFVEKRLVINGIEPCSLLQEGHLKPWEVTQKDLAKIWKGNTFYPDSLVAVATALGLPSPKDALDGSQVSEYFYDNKLKEIVEYCEKDVVTTIRVYRKLAFLPDITELFDVKKEQTLDITKMPILEKVLAAKKISLKDASKINKLLVTKEEKEIALDIVRAAFGEKPRTKLGDDIVNEILK